MVVLVWGDLDADGEVEGGALVGLAFDPHAAAHELAQPAGDDQPEAGSVVAPRGRRVHLREGVEQPVLLLLRYADPRVRHLELQLGVLRDHRVTKG